MTQCDTHIFITGIFRSGTTLLTRAMSAHSKVNVFYQPFTSLFRHAVRKFWQEKGCWQSRPMGDPLILEQFYKDFNEKILSISFTQNEIEEIKRDVCKDYEIDSSEKSLDTCKSFDNATGNTFFELFISGMKNARDILNKTERTMLGIKEVWCEDFLPAFLAQDIEKIKCIHIIRDPRAVVVSRNYGTYLQESCNGERYPVLFVARSWRRSIELYRKLSAVENYFLVRYEDLVVSPESTLRGISNFLGIEFDPVMLDYTRYLGGDGNPWEGNIDSRKLTSIDSDSSIRWKNIISEDDLFLCEFLCEKEMAGIGYELTTDYTDTQRFLSLEEDIATSKNWLCEYGHCLNAEEKNKELERKDLLN